MNPRQKAGHTRLTVVVVGGGIAGTACALRLAEDGHRVTLLKGEAPAPTAPDEEIRFYALSPASAALLAGLGVDLEEIGGCRYTDMQVWGGAIRDGLHFSMADAPVGLAALGHIVGHGVLLNALQSRAEEGIECLSTRARTTRTTAGGVEIDCSDGDLLTADLVVAADGADSLLREAAGIDMPGWDYRQRGIVANVHCDAGLRRTAWQRFLPSGPVALLPLDEARASIVWSADEAVAEELLAMDDGTFAARLGEAVQGLLGTITLHSRRASFPLRARHAERYYGERLALLGDSAHVVHPLAGQGLNLGLGDVEALASAIGLYGDHLPRALRAYSRRRRAAVADMLAVTDGLYRLFGPAGSGVSELRDAGMALVHRTRIARQWLVSRALGVEAGPTPTQIRG